MPKINGIDYKADEVKKIGDNYYIIGKTCWKIKNRWRSIDDEEVAFDSRKGCYDLKSSMQYGYVDGAGTQGYFTLGPLSIDTSYGYYLNFNDCPLQLDSRSYRKYVRPGILKRPDKYDFGDKLSYNASEDVAYINAIKAEYASSELPIGETPKMLSRFTKGYSFGIEFETNTGRIPEEVLGKIGLIPLKDGSLRLANGTEPYEYATCIMTGPKALQSILDQCFFLQHYCDYDYNGSMHLHIGGLRTDKNAVVALYKVCCAIQSELYDLVPYCKRDPQYFLGSTLPSGDSRKNYARLLPGLPDTTVAKQFVNLVGLVSDGNFPGKSYSRGSGHPKPNKWNHNHRYYTVNFEHLVLGRNPTVEFRIHHMTTDNMQVIPWLFICLAIVRYAEAYACQINSSNFSVNLDSILEGYATQFGTSCETTFTRKFADALKQYVKNVRSRNFEDACFMEATRVGHHVQCHYYFGNSNWKTSSELRADLFVPQKSVEASPLLSTTSYEKWVAQINVMMGAVKEVNNPLPLVNLEENAENDDFWVIEEKEEEEEEKEEEQNNELIALDVEAQKHPF